MDIPLWGLWLGFAGVVITALAGVVASIITNQSEKSQAVDTAMADLNRERLAFKDEQIKALEKTVNELKEQIANLRPADPSG